MASLDTARLLDLFEHNRAALTLYARNWVDESLAADAVQQAFVKLFLLRDRPDEPRAWLFRATRNEAISMGRAKSRRRAREQAFSIGRDTFESSPASLVDRDTIAAVVSKLGEQEREVVILRVWADLNLEEIAAVTSMSVASVHRTYQRALAAIRAALEATWHTNRK